MRGRGAEGQRGKAEGRGHLSTYHSRDPTLREGSPTAAPLRLAGLTSSIPYVRGWQLDFYTRPIPLAAEWLRQCRGGTGTKKKQKQARYATLPYAREISDFRASLRTWSSAFCRPRHWSWPRQTGTWHWLACYVPIIQGPERGGQRDVCATSKIVSVASGK